jgi:ABC-2 type transport system ATP-binding protein
MTEAGLSVEHLTKRFRKVVAVNDISFAVPRGSICGLVGPNGAGKTTTIRMLLDLVRRDAGTVRVLGMDPVRNRLGVLSRVGYVPEKHHMYEWMRVQQLLEFVAGVYPRWDWQESRRLNEILNLPLDRTVKALSRGELAKLALIVALSHRPEVLLLDEPTSGLDPLIRRDFLSAMVGLLKDRDRIVLFSTHILSDVERVSDQVIVMNEGTIVAHDTLEALRARFRKLSLLFRSPPPEDFEVPGARRVDKGLREWVAIVEGNTDIDQLGSQAHIADVAIHPLTLEEVFVELVAKKEDPRHAESAR